VRGPRVSARVSAALVVLTVIAAVASTVSLWARATLLDTDRFMAVVQPALDDPSFATAMTEVVTEQVLAGLDLDARVTETLEDLDELLLGSLEGPDLGPVATDRLSRLERPRLTALAPGIATALEARVAAVVETTVDSDLVTAWLPELVRRAHAGGVAVVRSDPGQLPNVDVRDGEVTIDLVPVIAHALQGAVTELRDFLPEIRLPQVRGDGAGIDAEVDVDELAAALRTRLPSDFGEVTVLRSGVLPEAQLALRTLDRLVGGLTFLTVGLLAVTVATSRRRRRTVVQLGGGLALAFGASALLVRRIEGLVLDAFSQPDSHGVAAALLGQLSHSLRSTALFVVVAAIGVMTIGYLVGRPPRPSVTEEHRTGAATEDLTDDRRRRPPAAITSSRIGREEP
jgi:hypothetical protein